MDSFVSRKKRKLSHTASPTPPPVPASAVATKVEEDKDADTDTKLAILASLHPELDTGLLFEALIAADGSIAHASSNLSGAAVPSPAPPLNARTIGQQTALPFANASATSSTISKPLTKRGQTLHLYTPSSIAQHTPCSLVTNFLPPATADALLRELLPQAMTFGRATFKLFDNVVQSPHSACFYVGSATEAEAQTGEYLYNGSRLDDVRQLTPVMRRVQGKVRDAVNDEVKKRIEEFYPERKKLRFQSPSAWEPNAAFVNCYDGGKESVGYHSDQLTYLGPRAIIGSISLGVAREFRVRKIVPKDEDEGEDEGREAVARRSDGKTGNGRERTQADEQGQIAIHLPHNSLLVMRTTYPS